MNGYIITADILCFLFLFIVLCGAFSSSKKNRKQSTKMFIALVITALFATVADAFSYWGEEISENDTLLRILNLLSYSFIVILIDIFSVYMISIIREKTELSFKLVAPIFLVSFVSVILLIAGTINGKLFTIIDHKFHAESWHVGAYIVILLYAFYLWGILLRYRDKLSIKSILALSSYLLFPFLLSLGVVFFDFPDFTYASVALSLMIIYVTIQARTISEVLLREEILNEVSYNDALTGLKNRRSYDEFLQKYSAGNNMGVAFFDLNSLKSTNDTRGHAAGDRLIKSFADMLKDFFRDGEVFRISGDEFVVLINPASSEEMDNKMKTFRELNLSKDRIAAMGYVYKNSGNMLAMVREAEKRMYKDKALYYKETGKDRRT